MLKGRGRDPRGLGLTSSPAPPAHLHTALQPSMMSHGIRPMTPSMQRAPISRPEPDYEVVEFPGDQYVNAKLQPPPPPPPRPPTGHPLDAGASCGLCGGGGARVRCTECGRRALCASCDDMYHRHPKRRHHQRQALSQSQIRDERPPLPPKVAPPVPPPRRHKIGGDRLSASPKPPMLDQRRATLNHISGMMGPHVQNLGVPSNNHQAQHIHQQIPLHLQTKMTSTPTPNHLGSMPYLPTNVHLAATQSPNQMNNLSHMSSNWNRPRGSQGFALHSNTAVQPEPWDNPEQMGSMQNWNRPLRRGASVLELGGGAPNTCVGCAHCAPMPWRYGSCASLDHPWAAPNTGWPSVCCTPPHLAHNTHVHQHPLVHPPQTPQPYRRGDNRTLSRAPSRAGSRAVSPAMSVRSRTSRRHKHRTPSPPPVPSSDADSESESESDHGPPIKHQEKDEDSLGPAPPTCNSTWQCEHCTFVNEPGVRVCVICCRTPTTAPQSIIQTQKVTDNIERLKITSKQSPTRASIKKEPDVERDKSNTKTKRERISTGCGPSENNSKITLNRLVTPTRETSVNNRNVSQNKHDMAVGPSPPREAQNIVPEHTNQDISTNISPARDTNRTLKVSPYKDNSDLPKPEAPTRHSISVGPSPPRESSFNKSVNNTPINAQKKSTGTSPPRITNGNGRSTIISNKSTVSNTGTSPPPQSISTQTYEVPNNWERASSTSRSRPRRRFRDDSRRERSHSRHSLSSDTRESERSVRTAGPENRWEWRERDSSPGGDWIDGYNRLSRRASHLDLRRTRSTRRSSVYGSEAPSPERQSNRAISLEALAGAGARREAERGMELAQLMGEAEKLGFSAAEVQAALTQSPAAPLAWLRQRWPSLCAGVRAAATRLAPTAAITELEARAALARHRGAMWPAVTECVERHRRQIEVSGIGEEGKLRGHVWGSPIGVDDDAAPPRSPSRHSHRMREDSSDEFEAPTLLKFEDDDWMYLPLNINMDDYEQEDYHLEKKFDTNTRKNKENVSQKLKMLLQDPGAATTNENLLLKELISENLLIDGVANIKSQAFDFIQSENDFIDAYNALTRLSPLPNINDNINNMSKTEDKTEIKRHVLNKGPILNNSKTTLNLKKNHDERKSQHKRNGKREKSHDKLNDSKQLNKSLVNSESAVVTNQRPSLVNQMADTLIPDTEEKEDEKANNLSDMVNNTQRLIQQMKEEINSDIHSIGGKTSTQSENEITSEESNDEQESSYSDTENGTDNLTSDEKEITSSEDEYHDKEIAKEEDNQQIMQYRTSSEDNENFEEALDHVETQSDDYKHTNIEILDSITRTLQEEHTLIVEIPESDQKNTTLHSRKQDRNNNFFVPANSFDEIYEELSNNTKQVNDQLDAVETVKIVIEPDLIRLPAKETIIYSTLKPVIATKAMISENKQLILNGKLENIEGSINNMRTTAQPTINEVVEDSSILDNTDADEQTTFSVLLESMENHINLNLAPAIEQNNNENMNSKSHLKQIEFDHINTTDTLIISPQPNTNKQDKNMNLQNSGQHINSEENNETNAITSTGNVVKDIIVKKSNTSNTQKSQISEKRIVDNTNANIKNHSLIKSSIPKLIKILPNNKNKIDNHFPKFVVSKVPIRRSSIKQYPAPAPPKNHFGNIQNGHVKQLQSKIFNNKTTPSKPVQISSETEVKATTSTLNKKKQAPPPPVKQDEKETSPSIPSTSTKKEKKQYFRETCRTEDEWTDSDSEDSQSQNVKPKEQSPYPPPSPPPPLTLRRVSGQLIDLAKIRISEGSPERQARMLLAEGATETWEQAQLAVELISRGTDAPVALLAALECTDLNSALAYLFQDCELCASRLPEHEMVSMLRCTHRCCRECARLYFTVQITERSIIDCVCPYCKLPELENLPEDAWLEYFAHLDILLKTLLEIDVHELFQRKLRDRTLARDPNFRWCMECSSGFFIHPKQKKVRCPECRSVSCAACRKPWTANHEGLTCEQYTAWLEDNDPERSLTAIQQHLRDNGLECPRCHFKYSLSRGGCMHFTCTQCKYEFCNGCGKPFTMGARCGLSEYCAKLGLHAHHPRNCLFYLRDKEPHELQTLLQMNNVNYETESAEGSSGRCFVQLQRETPTGLVDGTCGNEAPTNYAGLCKNHYLEYLSRLVRRCSLDPLPILNVDDLETLVRRAALRPPPRPYGSLEGLYKRGLIEIVKEKIPLD